MREILLSYLRRLTNLSGNSRSIFLPKLPTGQFIDIHEFDYVRNEPSFSILEAILSRKAKIPLCEVQNSREEDANRLSQKLKQLKREDHLIFEERGAKDLYVGWPFVKGKFSDGTLSRCPLLFFPVTLEFDKKDWYLVSRKDVNVTMNKSFLLAYAYFNSLPANENLLERVFDDFDKESKGFRTDLYELLKAENLEVNFNQDNFSDVLTSFTPYQRVDLEASEKDGELKLYPEAVVGIFPQAGSYLVPDYLTMLEHPKLSTIENFFAERNLDEEQSEDTSYYRFLKRVKEDQTFTPFKMDAYQENVIKAIKKGNSAVVQGPPGTGKSQLICNLVADYIARGKNVLVVSQKRAALDVVFERLKEKELNDFIGLLHDFKNDRKSIYEQLEGQMDRLEDYQSINNSLDAIQLERNFLKTSRRIDQLDEELSEFKESLFDESECALSVKELYLTSDPHGRAIGVNLEYRNFKFDTLDSFKRTLNTYARYGEKFLNEHHPWFNRKSFANYQVSDLQLISKHLDEIRPYINVLETVTEKAIGKKVSFEDVVEIIKKHEEIKHLVSVLKDPLVFHALTLVLRNSHRIVTKERLVETEKLVMQSYEGNGAELSLKSEELGRFQEALDRSLDARKSIFKWLRWKLFSKDKIFITRVLVNNGLKSDRAGFDSLLQKVDNRLNLEHNLSLLKDEPALGPFPKVYTKVELKNWFFYQKQAAEAQTTLDGIRHMNEYISPLSLNQTEYTDQLSNLLKALEPIGQKLEEWESYFSIPQLRQMFASQLDVEQLLAALKQDFDSLCEFDKLQAELTAEELSVINKLLEEEPRVQAEHWWAIFDNSLRLAWIEHIEQKFPILRAVSSQKFEDMQTEMQDCVKEKLRISVEILLLKARERVYKNVEYNRLNNRVTYRDLYHQVTKKRRIWPVRKVIANYPREVFDLIPCWLASPESASAIFPMEKIFDLVIFDEASQCFVEKGIPAIFRGKQVVIAGDDKQLQPNDLYKVRWEEENVQDVVELDFDSLLNLGSQHLMQVQLNGHYRSKNLDLIRFSNEHFYGQRLKMLPDFKDLNEKQTAIDYVKVEGFWQKNTNHEEAERVAQIVASLLKAKPDLEIGVVTFNASQQMYILDFLETYSIAQGFIIPESLIVKNIENIQGDEKDVIIFSTVYAPDLKGNMNMNFGSLNAEGGENRLNVAITRAKEKIYLVTSIMPQQLQVENSKNEGPKLLKKYLEYAYAVSNKTLAPAKKSTDNHSANWFLKNKIEALGFEHFESLTMDHSLPFVDLALKYKGEYLAALLTDDDQYHQDISIKATHVYRPFTLKQKNWTFNLISSRQFWSDPEHVRERINRMISRSIDE
ncbi:AAA domain-containing protein [Reichenbachiella carrageenanivorans]|uniref:AAA domain-containing protein n=1 Tax=Reichenbachiella carrageenanivorans TaxID=2979869 RepID=A0ABY6D622_9BACT|nr:AAA domain-containing protein [Reichenbachiella carrageenanivorans]UXX80583.1 AAA domain-containing protein [Reichenbachiella carrageenanivorans]